MSLREQRREFRRDAQRRAERAKGARVPLAYAVYMTVLNVTPDQFELPAHEMRMGGTPEVYIEVKRAEQEGCTHFFGQPDRFGNSYCLSCGTTAWSAWWVREGLYGDRTHEWMVSQDRCYRDMVEQGGIEAVQSTLGAQIIAVLDESAPAKEVTS